MMEQKSLLVGQLMSAAREEIMMIAESQNQARLKKLMDSAQTQLFPHNMTWDNEGNLK